MKKAQPLRLAVLLPDSLKAYVAKGEIKARYYNPESVFDEVYFVSGAMAAGLPVVASAVPAIQEVLDGAGYIVEHAPERFREAIRTLLENPSEYLRCRQEGLRRAAEIDGAVIEQKEVGLYRNLMKGRGGGIPLTPGGPGALEAGRGTLEKGRG